MPVKKFVLIGAGSMAFSQALITAIGSSPEFAGSTIGLVDINENALDVMTRLTSRLASEIGWDIRFEASTDRRDLLPGADVVSATIAVGGHAAYEKDILIPSKYGYIQGVGDTTGPGGLARALRHVPVMMEIAQDIKNLCPAARFYNYTNPMTILTQAVNNFAGLACTGLCIGVELTKRDFCHFVGVDPKDVVAYAGGLNHIHVLLEIRKGAMDLYEIGRKKARELFGSEAFRAGYPECIRDLTPFNVRLLDVMGYYPGPLDDHVSEFFPQFATSTEKQRKDFPYDKSYYRYVCDNHPKTMQYYRDMADGRVPVDRNAFSRETAWEETQMTEIELALESPVTKLFHINIPNRGYIANLPDSTVVEVPVFVDSSGYHPVALGNLPAAFTPTIARLAARLDLTIEAATEGDRRKAVQSFINDPACTDIDTAEKCINEMINEELQWLPRFR